MDYESFFENFVNITNKHCIDYPNIENAGTMERLYALESTIIGLELACDDLHAIVETLSVKCDLTREEIFKMFLDNLLDDKKDKN
jgi:hypothetical protein